MLFIYINVYKKQNTLVINYSLWGQLKTVRRFTLAKLGRDKYIVEAAPLRSS